MSELAADFLVFPTQILRADITFLPFWLALSEVTSRNTVEVALYVFLLLALHFEGRSVQTSLLIVIKRRPGNEKVLWFILLRRVVLCI